MHQRTRLTAKQRKIIFNPYFRRFLLTKKYLTQKQYQRIRNHNPLLLHNIYNKYFRKLVEYYDYETN